MTIGQIIIKFGERMTAGDEAGAMKALDMFFHEWPELNGLRVGERDKLFRDIRGLVLESWRNGPGSSKSAGTSEEELDYIARCPECHNIVAVTSAHTNRDLLSRIVATWIREYGLSVERRQLLASDKVEHEGCRWDRRLLKTPDGIRISADYRDMGIVKDNIIIK